MRYKFRGKRKDNGKWVYGYYAGLGPNNKSAIKTFGNRVHHVAEDTVGQYTGLKDKKGKEIYEGDIVEFNNYENGEMYKGLVVFHDCSFCIDVFDDYDYRYMRKFHYIKILGNKYENPELLMEAKDELEN